MNIEELRDYCLSKPVVTESFPFDENTLVFKVKGKIFLLTDLVDAFSMNIKNTPEKIVEQREDYAIVQPGYHMNKQYWNTVLIDGSITDTTLKSWIDQSYHEVLKGLSKKEKLEFVELGGATNMVFG